MDVLARLVPLLLAAALLVALPSWGLAGSAALDRGRLTDVQARAGFLYNCAMFVMWPLDAGMQDRVVIGVAGDDALLNVVSDLHGRKVNGRTLSVASLKWTDATDGVHVLYVGEDDRTSARTMLNRIGTAPVLTVGEHDDFISRGGVVRLFTAAGRLRFEINMTRADEAGLRISSKMLGLARIVR